MAADYAAMKSIEEPWAHLLVAAGNCQEIAIDNTPFKFRGALGTSHFPKKTS